MHDWRSWQRVGLIILRSWVRSPHCAQEKYARFSLALLAQQVALWSYVPTVHLLQMGFEPVGSDVDSNPVDYPRGHPVGLIHFCYCKK